MIPAPLLALVRYAVVYSCGRLAARGWTFFSFDADTTDAVVQVVAMLLAVGATSVGVWAATVRRVLARLATNHKPALVAAATQVVTAEPALATRAVTVP